MLPAVELLLQDVLYKLRASFYAESVPKMSITFFSLLHECRTVGMHWTIRESQVSCPDPNVPQCLSSGNPVLMIIVIVREASP